MERVKKLYLIIILFLFTPILSYSDELLTDIEGLHTEIIDDTINRLNKPIIIALSILTVIQIIKISIEKITISDLSGLISKILNTLLSFSFYVYIIENAKIVIDTLYSFFLGIGNLFTGRELTNVSEIWSTGLETTSVLWKMVNDWTQYIKGHPFEVLFSINEYIEDGIKAISILGVIFFIYLIYGILVSFLLFVIIQFKLGIALTLLFVAGSTNETTKEYVGNKLITSILLGGMQLTITTLLMSIFIEILDKSKFNQEMTIREVKLESIYIFLCIGVIMSILIFKINRLSSKLSG